MFAAGAQGATGPLRWLSGDAAGAPAVASQDRPAIAAGGSGYLVAWQDQRTILRGAPNTPDETLLGNSQDLYAARLDAAGNLVDREPIVLANGGHVQGGPSLAWNGQVWLVAYLTHRPGDYYKTDIVAVRVAPDGRVLDPQPIQVAQVEDSSAAPSIPAVASDGAGWAVVWEQFSAGGVRGVQGTQVHANGMVAHPGGRPLHFDSSNTFAHDVAIGFASDRYLVTWVRSGDNPSGGRSNLLVGKRFTAGLDPLDATPFVIDDYATADAERPSVASDGVEFFVAWHERVNVSSVQVFAARVSRTGQVLDPAGVKLGAADPAADLWPSAAWDGARYAVAFNQTSADGNGQRLYVQRVGRDGLLADAARVPLASSFHEGQPAVASTGDGGAQVVYARSLVGHISWKDDIWARNLAADGSRGAAVSVSPGLPRQSGARAASHAGGHLLVFLSEVAGETRLLAQRLDASGNALDAEPLLAASGGEGAILRPDVAWNGSLYQVVWQGPEGVVGRRLAASGAWIDPAPRVLLAGTAWKSPAVGALGGDFLLVATYFYKTSTVWQNWLRGVRIGGGDGQVLDAPFLIRGGYELDPRVVALGGNWLVVWESRVRHDMTSSYTRGAFVSPAGAPSAPFDFHPVSQTCGVGCGDDPDVAVQGETALVVWSDNGAKIDGRLIKADGTFPGSELEIAQAVGDQRSPAATGDGQGGWVVAWEDYRSTDMLKQLRADIYTARLDAGGLVLDPGGIQISSGPLPEVMPELAPVPGSPGSALLAYSALNGREGTPVGFRIGLRTLGGASGTEPPPPPPPASSAIASLTLNPASVVGGKISTATVTLASPAPSTGAKVMLASANTAVATVPVSVTVAAGTTSKTFAVTSKPVASTMAVGISASYAGATKTAALTVQPPVLSGLTLSPATFTGGCQGSTGKVTLSGKAPAGGSVVILMNTNPAATVPSSVTVPAGATYATFAITAPAVSALQTGAVGASFGGVAKSVTLRVQPVGLKALALTPNPVVGPNSVTGTVTLTCAAPAGGTVVALSSSTTAVARPTVASLTIPAGSAGGTFSVTTADVSAVGYATIKAVAGGVTKTVRLTVNP